MKTFVKTALAAAALAGTVLAAAAPAQAAVGFSFGFGAPAYGPRYYGPPPAYYDCYGPYYYNRCGYPVYGDPVFYDGIWFNSAPYRSYGGHREFWVHNGWHSDVRVGGRGGGGFRRR